MTRARALMPWVYPLAALLVLVPVLDVMARTWPPRPEDMRWRFGGMGVALNTLVTPLLGIGLAMIIAALLDQRRVLRGLAILALLLAVALMSALAVFTLDLLQLRATIPGDARAAYDLAAIEAFIAGTLCVPVSLILGLGGWAAGRRRRRSAASTKHTLGLVMHPRKESRV